MTQRTECPTNEQWTQFLLGQSPPEIIDRLADHLSSCESCSGRIEQIDDGANVDLALFHELLPAAAEIESPVVRQIVEGAAQLAVRHRPQTPAPESTTNGSDAITPQPISKRQHRLGKYELHSELGRGSFGVVFLATDLELNRQVAIKFPHPTIVLGDREKKMLRREAQICARFDHPGLIRVFEFGESDDTVFIASEYCAGANLMDWLDTHGPMPVRDAVQVVMALADALQHAHQAGVIHRDIKPRNIFLAPSDDQGIALGNNPQRYVLKLADFGVAMPTGDMSALTAATRTWGLAGTLNFMAPEVIANTGTANEISDVYSLGVVLFQLITGRLPFDANSTIETMRKTIDEEAPWPGRFSKGVPHGINRVCLQCLNKSPAKRYHSAGALADDLRNFLEGRPVAARRHNNVERAVFWARRRPAVATLTATLIITVFAVAIGLIVYNRQLTTALERADASEIRTLEHLYSANMRLASQAFEAGDFVPCRTYLDRCTQQNADINNDPDNRGIEWHLLSRMVASHENTNETSQSYKPLLNAHPGGVTCVTYSHDGRHMATSGRDGRIRVWKTLSGQLQVDLDAHKGDVNIVAFDFNDSQLVTGGDDGYVRIWNLTSKKLSLEFYQEGRVFEAVFTPDSRVVVSGGDSDHLHLWSAATGELIFKHATGPTSALAVFPDKTMLASAHADRAVYVWNTPEIARHYAFIADHRRQIDDLSISPDGNMIVTGGRDNAAKVWNRHNGKNVADLYGHFSHVHSTQVSPDGKWIVTASRDKTLRIWDFKGNQLGVLRGHASAINSVAVSPDSVTIATASMDGTVRFWSISSLLEQHNTALGVGAGGGDGNQRAASFSHDGKQIVAIASNCQWRIVNTKTNETKLQTGTTPVPCRVGPALSCDGQFVACDESTEQDQPGLVALWNAKTGRLHKKFVADSDSVHALEFSPTQPLLATAGIDGMVRLWNYDGQLQAEISENSDIIRTLAFSPNGTLLASGGDDNTVVVWDLQKRKVQTVFRGHNEKINTICFSPDSNSIASGSAAGDLRLWRAASGDELNSFSGHTKAVTCVAISPDGKTLLSGDLDKSLRFWQIATGQEMVSLRRVLDGNVTDAQFSPDGSGLLFTQNGHPSLAFLWDAEPMSE